MDSTGRSLGRSYRYCERLARREAGNFYPAFRVLPRPQRLAMCALYSFMRIADDLSDEPGPLDEKRRRLADWRQALAACLRGSHAHPIHEALRHTIAQYGIPLEYLHAVLDGVEMDLGPVRFATFADLRVYCYRVASAVGLACIHIWGFKDPRALDFAEKAGIAFQLTNILRDLGEDAQRGRLYLPGEDLERFGVTGEQIRQGRRTDAFRALMRFEVERARRFYEEARPLERLLAPSGRAVFRMMARTYRGLLELIEEKDYDVFTRRLQVSRWHKLLFALEALPVRLGWF